MTIQAIETFYKGYKFRSRLEARWAVFFDALGIKWLYEVEGFELPSGRYLPDFFLPERNSYIEIKPPHARPTGGLASVTPSVYMAGRMVEPCWRPFDVYADDAYVGGTPLPRQMRLGNRKIKYTGPFRTHLSNHSFLHGLDCAAYCYEPEVFARSIAGIKACEIFFALFEDLEAYGTLVEVGMAHAMGKRIVVGFTETWTGEYDPHNHGQDPESGGNDLWFAAHCAEKVLTGSRDEVLASFNVWLGKQYPFPKEMVSAGELSAGGSAVCIFYGDPIEALNNAIWWRQFPLGDIDAKKRDAAALAARQARFEFGQSGK